MAAAFFRQLTECFGRPSKAKPKQYEILSSYYDYSDPEKQCYDNDLDQAANEIVAALLSAETDGPALQKQLDDIIIISSQPDRHSLDSSYKDDDDDSDINSNSIKKKWIRKVARAILHRLEKIMAVLLAPTDNNDNDGHHHHHHHHHRPKLGKAMQKAFDRAVSEAKTTLSDIPNLPRNHPVYCSLVALGILVLLAPWALEALGFAEAGPVAGMYLHTHIYI